MTNSQPYTDLKQELEKMQVRRLVGLCLLSVVLTVSLFMAIFAPLPIAFSILIYGRAKGGILSFGGLLLISLLSFFVLGNPGLIFFYSLAVIIAFGTSEIVLRNIPPFEGVMKAAGSLLLAIGLFVLAFVFSLEKSLRETLTDYVVTKIPEYREQWSTVLSQGGEQGVELLALLNDPNIIVNQVLYGFPTILIVGIFLWVWGVLLVILRSNQILRQLNMYAYTERNLLRFRMPDWTILPLIFALGFSLYATTEGSGIHADLALMPLFVLGVFYFFQGFGVFHDLLNMMKMKGFLRTLFMVFTLVFVPKIIALLGLFDVWINFRKKFAKK